MEFTTKETGAKVVIEPADFRDAFLLKTKIQKAFKDNNLDPQQAIASGDFISLIMTLDSSVEVFDGIFDCLKKSRYNDVKITPETFAKEETRIDCYEVFYYCLKVNVYPFFKSLVSLLNNFRELK